MIWLYIILFSSIISLQLWYLIKLSNTLTKSEESRWVLIEQLKEVSHTLGSVRVKHGQTWETFMPLMSVFEKTIGPKENAVFMGQPIDLIYFNEDELIFVEVKTGNSRLSSKQRHIRNLVQDRKVKWMEVNDTLQE